MTDSPELGAGGKVTTALSLTMIGGFVDAVGYIALFQIFTANMSGNSVHVGMYLGKLEFSDLARPACAIAAFLAGSTLTRIAMTVAARNGVRRIATYTLAFEALLLLLFARATPVMELGRIVDLHSAVYFSLVALLAFAMGVQTATLTHVGALTVYTTFVTGTLTKISESLTRSLFWGYDQAEQSGRPMSHIVGLAAKQRRCTRDRISYRNLDLLRARSGDWDLHQTEVGAAVTLSPCRGVGRVCCSRSASSYRRAGRKASTGVRAIE